MKATAEVWISSLCQQGMARQNIEDCLLIRNHTDERYALFGVFDGMGGLDKGEVACTEACKIFNAPIERTPEQELIARAHKTNEVLRAGPKKQGVAASIVIVDKYDMNFNALSLGDSRIYRYRNSNFEQLSKDDKPAVGKNSVFANALTNALGIRDTLNDFDVISGDVVKNDKWLLTTDGIHSKLEKADIKETLAIFDKNSVVLELAKQALNRKSEDDLAALFFSIQ